MEVTLRRESAALEGKLFDRLANSFDEEIVGGAADEGAGNRNKPAADAGAHSDQQTFGDIFQYGAGHDQTCFDTDGDGNDRHEFFEGDTIGAAAMVNDAESDAELLGKIVEHVRGDADDHGKRTAKAGQCPGAGGQPGTMFYKGVDAHFVDAFFYAILVDAVEDSAKTDFGEPGDEAGFIRTAGAE